MSIDADLLITPTELWMPVWAYEEALGVTLDPQDYQRVMPDPESGEALLEAADVRAQHSEPSEFWEVLDGAAREQRYLIDRMN